MEKKAKTILIVGAIAAAALVLTAALVLAPSEGPYSGPNSEYIGKYAEYNVSGVYGSTPYTGTFVIKVIGASPDGIQVRYDLRINGTAINSSETAWIDVDEGSALSGMYRDSVPAYTSPLVVNGVPRSADVYIVPLGDIPSAEVWVVDDMVRKIVFTQDDASVTCILTKTNIV